MAAKAKVEWYADVLLKRVRRASRLAVNDVVDAARDDAKASHEWVNRSGQLEEEIISEHATARQRNPTGRFGTTRRRGFYGLFHEEGTIHEHARPFLRPAADRHFRDLADKIREHL